MIERHSVDCGAGVRAGLLGWLILSLAACPSLADDLTPDDPSPEHWSFRPILHRAIPTVMRAGWMDNPIDAFILNRLEAEGLEPSPPASRETLIRRVTLDLIGLPPTPEEVLVFVRDSRPDAYERLVDRLLVSPHYGERWARPWLDLAHYADSDGYLTDQLRPFAWRYRQWVVEALNRDMPFDQFTIEQLAGDLLPESSISQKIATGFLRQTLTSREGGDDVEEYRTLQVKDRTSTVGTVWLGLTLSCAQCHDHKYDPISQHEFYELYAFFNTADEVNVDAPLPGELERFEEKRADYERQRQELIGRHAEQIAELQRRWELRLLEAAASPGVDYRWDRSWENLGLVWGQGQGEGQLEGQDIVKLDPTKRSKSQQDRLFEYFLEHGSTIDPSRFEELKLSKLRDQIDKLNEQLPKLTRAPVVREAPTSRPAFVQNGGIFNDRGEAVTPSTPACLPPLPANAARTRLALAQWLVAQNNPLTSRVTVNRIWQEFFGRGLVPTSDDFGSQGESPTHPQLLDWLAHDLMDHNWSIKQIHRRIVTSNVYRQSSKMRPELEVRDPENRLLARQTNLRLSAEAVRDCTLAVSGLLIARIGGPSGRPPELDNEVKRAMGEAVPNESDADDRHRRALYIFTRRTMPFPQLETFDAPSARVSCARRERSNTPLQALTLLNDPVFFESAQALALRIIREQDGSIEQRVDHGFQICLARLPEPSEKEALVAAHRRFHEILQRAPQSTADLLESDAEGIETAEAGAWVGVASVLLNLHEFITRD